MTSLDEGITPFRAGDITARAGRPAARRRVVGAEAVRFLLVGAAGYVVDVVAFNLLWGTTPFDEWDPSIAKIAAVALAMVVTYLGNAVFTWPGRGRISLRQILLFVAFNAIGLGFSLVTLWISHDLLGLRTRLDDNLSANVIGLALGTALRYLAYRHFVFGERGNDGAGGRHDGRLTGDPPPLRTGRA